jgi:hypothetical protein
MRVRRPFQVREAIEAAPSVVKVKKAYPIEQVGKGAQVPSFGRLFVRSAPRLPSELGFSSHPICQGCPHQLTAGAGKMRRRVEKLIIPVRGGPPAPRSWSRASPNLLPQTSSRRSETTSRCSPAPHGRLSWGDDPRPRAHPRPTASGWPTEGLPLVTSPRRLQEQIRLQTTSASTSPRGSWANPSGPTRSRSSVLVTA